MKQRGARFPALTMICHKHNLLILSDQPNIKRTSSPLTACTFAVPTSYESPPPSLLGPPVSTSPETKTAGVAEAAPVTHRQQTRRRHSTRGTAGGVRAEEQQGREEELAGHVGRRQRSY